MMSMRKTASARTAEVPLVLASSLALLLAFAVAPSSQVPRVESRLEILTVATGARDVVWSAEAHFEAPNWSRDGRSLIFNQGGRSTNSRSLRGRRGSSTPVPQRAATTTTACRPTAAGSR